MPIRVDRSEAAPPVAEQVVAAPRNALARGDLARETRSALRQASGSGPSSTVPDLKLIGADGKPLIPVLVFDQFEEAFTLGWRARERGSRRARS